MISRKKVNMIYAKTDSTVKNREYAFTKTFESVFDEDIFFNSYLMLPSQTVVTLLLDSIKIANVIPCPVTKA